jgi:hypothetical protein
LSEVLSATREARFGNLQAEERELRSTPLFDVKSCVRLMCRSQAILRHPRDPQEQDIPPA